MTIMIIFGSFLPSLLVGLAPPIYSDLGADIVYGIISLKRLIERQTQNC